MIEGICLYGASSFFIYIVSKIQRKIVAKPNLKLLLIAHQIFRTINND